MGADKGFISETEVSLCGRCSESVKTRSLKSEKSGGWIFVRKQALCGGVSSNLY